VIEHQKQTKTSSVSKDDDKAPGKPNLDLRMWIIGALVNNWQVVWEDHSV
jgi:hypothetical protein